MIRALVSVGGYYANSNVKLHIYLSMFIVWKMLLIGQRACFVILAYIKVYIYYISTVRRALRRMETYASTSSREDITSVVCPRAKAFLMLANARCAANIHCTPLLTSRKKRNRIFRTLSSCHHRISYRASNSKHKPPKQIAPNGSVCIHMNTLL